MLWAGLLSASAACYLLKLAGVSVVLTQSRLLARHFGDDINALRPGLPDLRRVAVLGERTWDEFIAMARGVDPSKVQRFVLGQPYATHPDMSTTGGIYILELNMDKIAKLSVTLFGPDSRYYTGN